MNVARALNRWPNLTRFRAIIEREKSHASSLAPGKAIPALGRFWKLRSAIADLLGVDDDNALNGRVFDVIELLKGGRR